jgi:hypothetical protein
MSSKPKKFSLDKIDLTAPVPTPEAQAFINDAPNATPKQRIRKPLPKGWKHFNLTLTAEYAEIVQEIAVEFARRDMRSVPSVHDTLRRIVRDACDQHMKRKQSK